eukprot:116406_1
MLLVLFLLNLATGLIIEPIGDWETIWNWQTAKCTNESLPDVSARAFILSNNDIEFLDSNSMAGFYQMRGPSLDNLTDICSSPVIRSGNVAPYATPSEYNNSIWIQGVWRDEKDANIVYGIIHNEFHGEKQSNQSICPSKELNNCWYSNTLCAISIDGGNTFKMYNDMNKRTCIVSPFKYIPDGGRQGMCQDSNILYNPIKDSYYYMWVRRANTGGGRNYPNGMCLWRTNNLSDPNAWRGWNGSEYGFVIQSVDPYVQNENFNPYQHVCQISESLAGLFQWSWTYNNVVDMYIHFGNNATDILYSYSKDMFNWSKPIVLLPTNFTGDGHKIVYPSLIDETSRGVNFEYSNEYPWLYLTRYENQTGLNRDIIRIKLKISP